MKPKPTLPKGRIVYCDSALSEIEDKPVHRYTRNGMSDRTLPCVLLRCTSTKQARALIKLHNTPREELVGRIKKILVDDSLSDWDDVAEAAVKEILP